VFDFWDYLSGHLRMARRLQLGEALRKAGVAIFNATCGSPCLCFITKGVQP